MKMGQTEFFVPLLFRHYLPIVINNASRGGLGLLSKLLLC